MAKEKWITTGMIAAMAIELLAGCGPKYADVTTATVTEPASTVHEASAAQPAEENSKDIKEDSVLKEELTERIQKVEEYCHVKFPDSYIMFIEGYNAGLPEANTFTANHEDYVIERFLGFISDYQDSPLGDYDIAVVMAPIETYLTDNPDLVGVELVPIANLSTGDYVCLDFKENQEEPGVCIWSSAESEEFHPVTYEVADSFQYFVESLE